jgi:hypothetical protein
MVSLAGTGTEMGKKNLKTSLN